MAISRAAFLGTLRIREMVKRIVLFTPLDYPLAKLVIWLDHLRRQDRMSQPVETVETFNESALILPSNLRTRRQLAAGAYEPEVTSAIRSRLTQGSTMVDLGANVGYYSVLAGRMVGPNGRVYAFEPDPDAYSYLCRNINLNHLINVTAEPKAVANTVGPKSFLRPELEGGHIVDAPLPFATTVQTTTLDDYFASISWPRVDLIKMDIEGGEAGALAGMKELSARNPQLALIMEFNLSAMRRAHVTPLRIAHLLRALGFRFGCVIEKGLRPISIDNSLPVSYSLYNLLLTK